MAEYIDRDMFLKIISHKPSSPTTDREDRLINGFVSAVKNCPAADVRPVTVCCDCKHFQVNVSPSGYLPQGVPEWECRYWCRPTDPTDFCSYGEKREES